jgi:hypothetical protein
MKGMASSMWWRHAGMIGMLSLTAPPWQRACTTSEWWRNWVVAAWREKVNNNNNDSIITFNYNCYKYFQYFPPPKLPYRNITFSTKVIYVLVKVVKIYAHSIEVPFIIWLHQRDKDHACKSNFYFRCTLPGRQVGYLLTGIFVRLLRYAGLVH